MSNPLGTSLSLTLRRWPINALQAEMKERKQKQKEELRQRELEEEASLLHTPRLTPVQVVQTRQLKRYLSCGRPRAG